MPSALGSVANRIGPALDSAAMADKIQVLADGKIAGIGALAPLYAATRSPRGTWILAGGGSYHGPANVLFTADGKTFKRIRPPKESFNPRAIFAIDDQRIVIAGQGQLDMTTNGGESWKPVKDPLPAVSSGIGWWTIAACDGRLWAAGNGYVIRSDDEGRSWKPLKIPGGGECYGLVVVSRDEAFIGDEGKIHHVVGDKIRVVHKCRGVYVYKLARGSDGTLVAAAGKGHVLVSRDGGKKWTKAKVPGGRDYVSVVFHEGRFLIGGSKGTLLALESDGKVTELAVKLPTFNAVPDEILAFAPMGSGVLVLGGRDMHASMTKRGVLLALGELSGKASAERTPSFVPPPVVKRTLRAPRKGDLAAVEVIPWQAAKARFKKLPTPEAPPKEVRVYSAMRVPTLHLVAEPGESLLVIFDGDVYVDGAMTLVSCEDDDCYLTVHVAGNVSAQNLALSLDPRLVVTGNLEVENLISCGAGRSYLDVIGHVTCRFAIAAQPAIVTAKKGLTGMAIGDDETFDGVDDILPEETAFHVLQRKLVDKDTSAINADDVRHALRNGTAVTQ